MGKGKIYKTDMDKIQKKLEEIGSGTFWKALEGKNVIRVLPPWNDKGLFYFEATLHYGLRREGKERALPCLGKGECPICRGIKDLAEGSREDQKLAKRFGPRTKYYANILDRKTGKICIWGFSRTILSVLLSAMADEDDYGDITDPEDGFDVIVERSGTSLDTKYQVRVRPKASEVGEIDWDSLFDLEDEVVEDVSEEELEEIVEENLSGGDGSSKKKKRRGEDDDDNNGDDDDKKKPKSKEATGDDIEVGSQVSFEDEEGEKLTGEVIKIYDDDEEARVKDEDGDKHTISLEDLTIVEEKKKKKDDNDDDEDDEKARRKRRKERREKRNKKKKRR